MKKSAAIALLIALCLTLFAGCGNSDTTTDPGFDKVAAAIEGVVSVDSMAEQDSSYIENRLGLAADSYDQALVMVTNVGTSSDEFGLFKGKDEAQVDGIKTAIQNYLNRCLEGWMPYHPEELPKLQNAQIFTEGNYVLYVILAEDTKAAANEAFTGCFQA